MTHSLILIPSSAQLFVNENLGKAWEQGYHSLLLSTGVVWSHPFKSVMGISWYMCYQFEQHKSSQSSFFQQLLANYFWWNFLDLCLSITKMQVWLLLTVTVILEPVIPCFTRPNGKNKFGHSCINVVWLLFVCYAYFYRSGRCCSYTVTWNFTHNSTARFSSCDGYQIQYSAD